MPFPGTNPAGIVNSAAFSTCAREEPQCHTAWCEMIWAYYRNLQVNKTNQMLETRTVCTQPFKHKARATWYKVQGLNKKNKDDTSDEAGYYSIYLVHKLGKWPNRWESFSLVVNPKQCMQNTCNDQESINVNPRLPILKDFQTTKWHLVFTQN